MIEITTQNGQVIIINSAHILYIEPLSSTSGAAIFLHGGGMFVAEQSARDIMRSIEDYLEMFNE